MYHVPLNVGKSVEYKKSEQCLKGRKDRRHLRLCLKEREYVICNEYVPMHTDKSIFILNVFFSNTFAFRFLPLDCHNFLQIPLTQFSQKQLANAAFT